MANEQLGVATEPPPESLWGALPLCSGGLSIGGLYICAVGLDILKFEQTSLLYSASYFNLGGAWSFVSEGISPPKSPPPWRRDSVANLQLAWDYFAFIWTQSVEVVMWQVGLQYVRFMSLWLEFRISVYGQSLWSSFRFSGSVFSVRFSLQFS